MNHPKKRAGQDTDLCSLLKLHHKKVYSICRLFANNYKEHQKLFAGIIAAASQNIRNGKGKEEKQTLLFRACINMSALHAIALEGEKGADRTLQFKSPDYQKSMLQFRDSIGEISDYEKFLIFLEFEQVPRNEIADLTGFNARRREIPKESSRKNFIPYLKEKLIWS
jgi:hypothetical protein